MIILSFQFKIQNSKLRIAAAALSLFLTVAFSSAALAQTNNCYTWDAATKTWKYNQACSQTGATPWQIIAGKVLKVNNTLTLSGTDNATLNIGTGGTLGTAAYADTRSFQPAGGSLNLVGTDLTTSVTNGTSASCSAGQKTWSAITQTGLGFSTGMVVTAYQTANPAVYMQGSVCSYSGSTLTIAAAYSQGTYMGTGWTIQISGPQGPQGATGTGAVPPGTAEFGFYASLPTDYLWASGPSYTACVSKTTYAALYAAIGDVATTENGCTGNNFGIPDMRGRMPIGTGQGATREGGGAGTDRVLGSKGGAETHTQTHAEMAAHIHTIDSNVNANVGQNPVYSGTNNMSIGFLGNTGYAGLNSPMSIMNPWRAGNWIIRYQ